MLHSFRAKIVLLATLLSGAVLAGLALLSLHAVSGIGLARIDRELQALADAHLHKPQPPQHWQRVDESLAAIYGGDPLALHVLRVNDQQGRRLYVSARWPAGLSGASFGLHESDLPAAREPAPDFAQAPPPPADAEEPPPQREPDGFQYQPRPPGPFRPGAPPPVLRVTPPRDMSVVADGRSWRFAVISNEQVTLIIGADLAGFHGEIRHLRNAFLVAAPLALLLLGCVGWVLAGQALRPVRVITEVAGGIGARELDRRMPAMPADREFAQLIEVINGMLARIERSYRQATRFSADAAHELKTPLTVLQGQLEQAVQGAPAASREQCTYAGLLEEVQRLKSIVRKLLLLAQADAGQLRLNTTRVDFSSVVQITAEDVPNLGSGLHVEATVAPAIVVMGDVDLLNQAVQNLAANAAKFNDARGIVRVSLHATNGRAVCTIANTGAGIPRAEQDRLFARFYRADKSRNRRVDGTGLGLSLAREIARAHGGDLVLERSDEELTVFALSIPLA